MTHWKHRPSEAQNKRAPLFIQCSSIYTCLIVFDQILFKPDAGSY